MRFDSERDCPRQLDSSCIVPWVFPEFGQGNRSRRGRPTATMLAVLTFANGPGSLVGRRSQDRQAPDGPETRTLRAYLGTVAPVRRGPIAGWQEGRGTLGLLTRNSIMKPEKGARRAPAAGQGSCHKNHLLLAQQYHLRLKFPQKSDTFNPKQTPPALGICIAHPITPQKRGVTVLTWLDVSTRVVSSSQSLCGNLQHDRLLMCLRPSDTGKVYLRAAVPRKHVETWKPSPSRSSHRGLQLHQASPSRASSST